MMLHIRRQLLVTRHISYCQALHLDCWRREDSTQQTYHLGFGPAQPVLACFGGLPVVPVSGHQHQLVRAPQPEMQSSRHTSRHVQRNIEQDAGSEKLEVQRACWGQHHMQQVGGCSHLLQAVVSGRYEVLLSSAAILQSFEN